MPHTRSLALLGLVLVLGSTGLALLPEPVSAPASEAAAPPFTLPEGFVAEKVAGPPLTDHPVMASFDEEGRLYLAENAGVNLRAPDLLDKLPSGIRRLVDTNGDGVFDTFTRFADRMTFPMGSLWHEGSLYCCSPPSLWRFDDPGQKGVARSRVELVTRFGFTGNAADIHGPFLGPDGWLYWTDGRHGHEITRPDGTVMKGKAARIFRCRQDGSQVEVVCGGGMDDPVEMAFTEEGEPFATVDIFQGRPSRVDALIYCVEGGAFPYHPSVLGEFRKTGPLLPAVSELGWVAPSGLTRYRGDAFGPGYRGSLFSTEFNTHRIVRHVLERDGASFRTRDEPFLVSTSSDFHPTDVLEDADGSLLVIDTGGWFRIGCPTSQIARPEVKGAIWRIRRTDAPRVNDPRGLKLPWAEASVEELAGRLDDPRWVVRDRAVQALRRRGAAAVPLLTRLVRSSPSTRVRRSAVWVASTGATAEAGEVVRLALKDPEASVRIAAARAAGLNRDVQALEALTRVVTSDEPAPRRQAATALGRLGRKEAVPALLAGLEKASDRFLEHALIFALIEIDDREGTLAGLARTSPAVRKGALIALDQMEHGGLTQELVVPHLDSSDRALRETALGLVASHPGWAGGVLDWLEKQLARRPLPAEQRGPLCSTLVALAGDAGVQRLVGTTLAREDLAADLRLALLEVVEQAPLDPLPASWVEGLKSGLAAADAEVVWQAVRTIRARSLSGCDEGLRGLVDRPGTPDGLRVLALAALAPRLSGVEDRWLALLRRQLDPGRPPLDRLAAADALRALPLADGQLLDLCADLPKLGALELPQVLLAFERARSRPVGLRLLEALEASPAVASVSAARLGQVLREHPPEVRQAAQRLLARLAGSREQQEARLKELEPLMGRGDPGRGRAVFFSKLAVCAACHTVKGDGGKVGPDLTKIGSIRSERDLLEAIVFPSASIVRDYEAYLVATADGRQHTGLIRQDTPAALHLVNAERSEIRLPRSAVESIEPSPVSLMPQGIDRQLSEQDLSDLLAFLRSLR